MPTAYLHLLNAQNAMDFEDLPRLTRSAAALRKLAPEDQMTWYLSWVAAMSEGELDRATGYLEAGKGAGMEPALYDELSTITADNQPLLPRILSTGAAVVGAWAAVLLLLLGAGTVLSSLTLTAATRLPDKPSGHGTGQSRAPGSLHGRP